MDNYPLLHLLIWSTVRYFHKHNKEKKKTEEIVVEPHQNRLAFVTRQERYQIVHNR